MILVEELRKIAKARFSDAEALLAAGRYDGAAYLCGYAIELILKSQICRVLHWAEFPATSSEFKNYQSFKTHDLDVLLHLTGKEAIIKTLYVAEWSAFSQWDPESRYHPSGIVKKSDAQLMIVSAKTLLRKL